MRRDAAMLESQVTGAFCHAPLCVADVAGLSCVPFGRRLSQDVSLLSGTFMA